MIRSSWFEKIIYGVKFCTEVLTLLKKSRNIYYLLLFVKISNPIYMWANGQNNKFKSSKKKRTKKNKKEQKKEQKKRTKKKNKKKNKISSNLSTKIFRTPTK